jgi:hypothetical protein
VSVAAEQLASQARSFFSSYEGELVDVPWREADNGIVFRALPDDEHTRRQAEITRDGAVLGTINYLGWQRHLVLYAIDLAPGVPATAEAETVQALLDQFDVLPEFFTHASIHHFETLVWYGQGPFAHGTVYCGTCRGRYLYYDTWDHIPPEIFEGDPTDDDPDATQFVTMCSRDADYRVVSIGGSADELGRRLVSGTWLSRIVMLRALSFTQDLDVDLIEEAHNHALLDPNYAVRQFASMQMSGFYDNQRYVPSIARQLRGLRTPLDTCERFGYPGPLEDGTPWDARQGRRNVRFALLYSLSNLAWNAVAEVHPWMAPMPGQLLAALEADLERFTPERDQMLYEIAVRELASTHPAEAFDIGEDEPFTLLEMLRYVVHRHRVVFRRGCAERDRFYWLSFVLDSIYESPLSPTQFGGEDDRHLTKVLYGPSPRVPVVEPGEMPPWLDGMNPAMAFMGPHVDPV